MINNFRYVDLVLITLKNLIFTPLVVIYPGSLTHELCTITDRKQLPIVQNSHVK